MEVEFSKYQGTGNDFVILDNRSENYDSLSKEEIALLCDRRFGIGADGLMMLCNAVEYDFEMKYFNADGAPGSMCGNGGRCIAAFANRLGLVYDECEFIAFDGLHKAKIENGLVSLKMNKVKEVQQIGSDLFIDTGSPHLVKFEDSIDSLDVVHDGRKIRNSAPYKEQGVNVNFVEKISDDSVFVRTYERGVEDETYSCGTGVTAAALAMAKDINGNQSIHIRTIGGSLSVSYKKSGRGFDEIWLTGPADFVFTGKIELKRK